MKTGLAEVEAETRLRARFSARRRKNIIQMMEPNAEQLSCIIYSSRYFSCMSRGGLINTECETHKKICAYMCTYSKCAKRLICENCRREHLDIHPSQFIYELSNLAEVHSYNKIDKLREILIKEKIAQETVIRNTYEQFHSIAAPFNDKITYFVKESEGMIQSELYRYLKANKTIIEETEKDIKKSETKAIKNEPNRMLEETINETEIINRREGRIVENGESYKWYSDTTREMCESVATEIKSMINVIVKLIDNCVHLQKSMYSADTLQADSHHELSFYKRYHASAEVASDRIKLEGDVLQSKKMLEIKDNEIIKSKKEVKDKVIKISELEEKIEGLTEELQGWQQKKDREEKERQLALEKQRRSKEEMLIKNGIIGSNAKSLCFQRKDIDPALFPLLLELVPNPLTLDISNHRLNAEQLQQLLRCQSVQALKFNFTKIDKRLIQRFLKAFPALSHLELNSCEIDDQILKQLSTGFTSRLKKLYLIDNKITDEGIQNLFEGETIFNNLYLEELYVSFNKLTSKSIDLLAKQHELKVLHIAKTQLRQRGAVSIGRHLKQIEELFIGSTGTNKEGFLEICKNCTRLKRFSVVANDITTQVVTEILLALKDLQWLDLSYCNFKEEQREKIEKLKIFNQKLEIEFGI